MGMGFFAGSGTDVAPTHSNGRQVVRTKMFGVLLPIIAGLLLFDALIDALCANFFSTPLQIQATSIIIEIAIGAIAVTWVSRSILQSFPVIEAHRISAEAEVAYRTTLLANVKPAIVGSDPSFALNIWNTAAEELFGWTSDDVQGKPGLVLLDTQFIGAEKEQVFRELTERGYWHGEATQKRKDGSRVHVEVHANALRDDRGTLIGYLSINHDATERNHAEEQLRRRVEEVQKLMEITPAAIWVADDPECLYIRGNRAANHFYEAADGENVSANATGVRGFFHEGRELSANELPMQKAALTGRDVRDAELDVLLPSGKRITILGSASPLRDEVGNIRGCVGVFVNITDRKKSERALRESERALRESEWFKQTLIDSSPDWIKVLDLDGNIISMNQGVQRLLGIKDVNQYIHGCWLDIWACGDRPLASEAMAEARRGGTGHFQAFGPTESGKSLWWDAVVTPIRDHRGEVTRLLAASRDITAQKQAEETLARSEERFRIAAQSTSDVIYEWDLADRIEWYGNIDALLGYGPGEFPRSRDGWFARVHEDDKGLVALAIERHLKGEIAYNCEYRMEAKSGEWRHWSARGIALRDPAARPYRWIGSITDITDQVKARRALELSEKQHHLLYGSMRDAFVSVDMTGRFIEFNEAYCEMLGYTGDELRSLTYTDITPAQWHASEAKILEEQVLPRGYSELYEKEYRAKEGKTFPIELRTILIRDASGQPSGMWAIVRDITSRKAAEELLRTSEEQFRSTFELAAVGIAHVALDGRWLRVNARLCDILGYTHEELLLMSFADITHPEDLQSDLEFVRQMLANERQQYTMEKRYIKKDGSTIWANLTVSLLRHPGGNPKHFISVVEDISERKKLDHELRVLTDELDSRVKERTLQLQTANKELESFSYSVSHDLRAPLRGIDGWSQALLDEYGSSLDERGTQYLDRVRSEAQRMGGLIDDLLMLAKVARADLRRTPFAFSHLVHRVVDRVRQRYPGREFDFVVQPDLTIDADPHLIEIVLTNLIDNACKFTRERSPARIEIGLSDQEGTPCCFVRDNGVGFDMTYAEKLFAPFQRLHRQSEYPGTGVGLATVYRIIARHGGRVWVNAHRHAGATFYFSL